MQNTIVVTGVDSKFFLMACLLYQSIKPTSAAKNFFVLDFGLKEEEKSFFRSKGILVDAPGDMGDAHPWALKAMLHDYVAGLGPSSNIVWVDSDILVNRNFGTALQTLLDEMSNANIAVAASPEMKLSEFISRFSNLSLWPFIRALTERKISLDTDYYNSGFVIFRSMGFLEAWSELAKSMPFHSLFDQNLFNLVIQGGARILPLPRSVWNFHASDFDGEIPKELPAVLHVTSHRPEHYKVHACGFTGKRGDGYELRLLIARPFLDYQFQFLEQFVASERAALCACGLLPADLPREKFFVEWSIPGDQLCPCQSGKPYQDCHGAA